jgi:5-methylthioribose kinase
MEPYNQYEKINTIKQQKPIDALRTYLKKNLNTINSNIRKKQTDMWRKKSVSPFKQMSTSITNIRKKQSSRWSSFFSRSKTPDKNTIVAEEKTPQRKKKVEWTIKEPPSKDSIKLKHK